MHSIFTRAGILELVRARYDEAGIETVLRREFGEERTLGSPDLRCLLLLGLRNTSTGSPWPVSGNPRSKYNQRRDNQGPGVSNLDLPLWQLVRASSAAPTFFVPEEVAVGAHTFVFSDGAVTTLNNPALQLFLMATLPAYQPGLADRTRRAPAGQRRDRHHRAAPGRPARRGPQPAQLRDPGAGGADPQRRRPERRPVPGPRRVPVRATAGQRARRPRRWRRAARRAAVQLRPVRRRDAPRQPRAARGRPPVHREPGPDRRRRVHRGDVRVRPGHLHPGRPGPLHGFV